MRAPRILSAAVLAAFAAACGEQTGGAGDPAEPAEPDGAPPSTCEHSTCLTGGALTAGCSSCGDLVCAARPECCRDNWREACVFEAGIACDEVCPATGEALVDPELRAGAPGQATTGSSHVVTPVLFVPADLADGELVEPAGRLFAGLAREGQGLYRFATGGPTFALAELQTVIGERDNADYLADGGVQIEVTEAIGRANDGAHDTWIFWYGGGGYAGAYGEADWNPALGYTAMVGEGSLFSHAAYVTGDPAWCRHIVDAEFRAECEEPSWIITAGMGAIVHELGHTFGLRHEDDHDGAVPPDSFMTSHWNYFSVRSAAGAPAALSEPYKDLLRASPFFAPR